MNAVVIWLILWTFVGTEVGWWTLLILEKSPNDSFNWSYLFYCELISVVLSSFMSVTFALMLLDKTFLLTTWALVPSLLGALVALPLAGLLWIMPRQGS